MIMTNKNKIIYIFIIIFAAVVVFLFAWFVRHSAILDNRLLNTKTIQINGATIRVDLATTEAQQVQGLSDRDYLASSTGMFFVFDRASYWGIWMKDMNFPIDVLWISDGLKIGDIVENMLPSSYPQAYTPTGLARYVLEVPAGTVEKYGIKVGQVIVLQ